MKIDRLLGETIYLLNHGRTSAQILAKYFEVSVRTIVRDMDTLSMAGIPIIANCGADGGYDVMDTFKMQRQVAGQTDYNYIICALQGLATAYENKNIEATLEKMKALTDHKESSMLMDLSVVHENRDINEMLYLLNHSIEVKHIISFLYTNSRNEEKQIEVEPVCVIYNF